MFVLPMLSPGQSLEHPGHPDVVYHPGCECPPMLAAVHLAELLFPYL